MVLGGLDYCDKPPQVGKSCLGCDALLAVKVAVAGGTVVVVAVQLEEDPHELEHVAVPSNVHCNFAIGTGIELVVLDFHIRYMVALNRRSTLVSDESS